MGSESSRELRGLEGVVGGRHPGQGVPLVFIIFVWKDFQPFGSGDEQMRRVDKGGTGVQVPKQAWVRRWSLAEGGSFGGGKGLGSSLGEHFLAGTAVLSVECRQGIASVTWRGWGGAGGGGRTRILCVCVRFC